MKLPKDFPKNCPPKEAKPARVTVYILVHSPIEQDDFDSLKKRRPTISFPTAELECQAHGVSVFERLKHIKRVRRRVRRLRHRAIALGTLTPHTGVFKPTSSQFGDSHRTWWIAVDVEPEKIFEIIEEK